MAKKRGIRDVLLEIVAYIVVLPLIILVILSAYSFLVVLLMIFNSVPLSELDSGNENLKIATFGLGSVLTPILAMVFVAIVIALIVLVVLANERRHAKTKTHPKPKSRPKRKKQRPSPVQQQNKQQPNTTRKKKKKRPSPVQQQNKRRPSPVRQRKDKAKAAVYVIEGKNLCSECEKTVYKSRKDAEAAVQLSAVKYSEYMRSYYDNKCGHWHLTSHLPRD